VRHRGDEVAIANASPHVSGEWLKCEVSVGGKNERSQGESGQQNPPAALEGRKMPGRMAPLPGPPSASTSRAVTPTKKIFASNFQPFTDINPYLPEYRPLFSK
jgi:hypothetical protein